MIYKPHDYQVHAIQHILQREVNPEYAGHRSDKNAALFLDMGLGKTSITLTALSELMYNSGEVNKCLIIAPKRVAENTWTEEIAKWDHLKYFRVSKIIGSPEKRMKALKTPADIYLISRDNIVWLVANLQMKCPFDMIVIDELSSFKNQKSGRFKALRKIAPQCNRIVGLTGTPIPNGLIDLWPQIYLLDQGQRLGKNITGYREAFFKEPHRVNNAPVTGWALRGDNKNSLDENESAREIMARIKDMCISMKAEDWLAMPDKIEMVTDIKLPAPILSQYKAFEKEQVLSLLDQDDLTITSAVAMSNKLLQFANGAVYTKGNTDWVEIHNEKIEALGERIEAANGSPVLCFYSFQSDIPRIQKHLKSLKPRLLKSNADLKDWNAGKIPFALGHPQSFGHGLNMQSGGHFIEWFGRPWGLEFVLQSIARLWRQGQTRAVISNSLACQGTLDYKVLASNSDKEDAQNTLMRAVKAIIKEYRA